MITCSVSRSRMSIEIRMEVWSDRFAPTAGRSCLTSMPFALSSWPGPRPLRLYVISNVRIVASRACGTSVTLA